MRTAHHGVPALWVVVAHRQAQLGAGGEATVGREDADGGRLERVGGREQQLAVIHAASKVGAGRALQHVVPLQQVGGQWVRADVRHRLLRVRAGPGRQAGGGCSGVCLHRRRCCCCACMSPAAAASAAACEGLCGRHAAGGGASAGMQRNAATGSWCASASGVERPPRSLPPLTRSRLLYSFCSRCSPAFCAPAIVALAERAALLLWQGMGCVPAGRVGR